MSETTFKTPLLKPDEVAAWLGVSRRRVVRLANAGKIPHVREGNGIAFVEDDVKRWIDEKRKGQVSA